MFVYFHLNETFSHSVPTRAPFAHDARQVPQGGRRVGPRNMQRDRTVKSLFFNRKIEDQVLGHEILLDFVMIHLRFTVMMNNSRCIGIWSWPLFCGNNKITKYRFIIRSIILQYSNSYRNLSRSILTKGGNAVDAAIATLICVGATNPQSSGTVEYRLNTRVRNTDNCLVISYTLSPLWEHAEWRDDFISNCIECWFIVFLQFSRRSTGFLFLKSQSLIAIGYGRGVR